MTIEAKDIQDIVKALSEAVEHKSAWVEVIKLLVWPAVVVFGFIMFRTPLSHFLGDLGRRLTKLSAFHVEIELSAVATPSV